MKVCENKKIHIELTMLRDSKKITFAKKNLEDVSFWIQFHNKQNKQKLIHCLLIGRGDKQFPNKYCTFGLTFQGPLPSL